MRTEVVDIGWLISCSFPQDVERRPDETKHKKRKKYGHKETWYGFASIPSAPCVQSNRI
jgi:hypothetical protein